MTIDAGAMSTANPVALQANPSPLGVESLTLSVVICAYTTLRWNDLCLAAESVLNQNEAISELILVIDHSEELHDLVSREFGSDPRVKVLRNNEKQGLSGARNTGVTAAQGDIVAFLDDDAAADPGWTTALMRHYDDSTVACVGGHADPIWPGVRPGWMPEEFDWVVGCGYIGQPTQLARVRNPIGCNMSLRRSVVDVVGGFRSEVGRVGTTPVGGEETELCIRILASGSGHQILFDPEMQVRHRVSKDRTTLRYFLRRCYHEGLSKAVVTELASANALQTLSTESTYIREVLPRGVLRGVTSMTSDGVSRAVVIVLGLVVTTAGYVRAKVSRRLKKR